MVPDRQKVRTDGHTDNAKTISLRLRRGIKIVGCDIKNLYKRKNLALLLSSPEHEVLQVSYNYLLMSLMMTTPIPFSKPPDGLGCCPF